MNTFQKPLSACHLLPHCQTNQKCVDLEWALLSTSPLTPPVPLCTLDSSLEKVLVSIWQSPSYSNTLCSCDSICFPEGQFSQSPLLGKSKPSLACPWFYPQPTTCPLLSSGSAPSRAHPFQQHSQLLHWVWEAWPFPFFLFCFLSSSRIFLSAPWQGKTKTDNARHLSKHTKIPSAHKSRD